MLGNHLSSLRWLATSSNLYKNTQNKMLIGISHSILIVVSLKRVTHLQVLNSTEFINALAAG